MTNPIAEKLRELAERVEAAAGPDRELDGLIEVARDPMRETILYNKPGRFPQEAVRGPVKDLILTGSDLAEYVNAPAYSASLDAAMTLVPEGWLLDKLNDRRKNENERTRFQPPSGQHFARLYYFRRDARDPARIENLKWGKGKSRAMALCAAALRARAAQAEAGDA